MSKNANAAAMPAKSKRAMTTKTLAYCAMLAALQVVLARLMGLMPNAYSRFSIEAIPTIVAGILFGPVAGGMVGFTSDLVGCLFSGYGYNPLFCLPPILYGVFGGIFRRYLAEKVTVWRLIVTIMPAVILGSWLWQSAALAYVYYSKGPFLEGFLLNLGTRGAQFAVVSVIYIVIVRLLFQSKIFNSMGVWPPKAKEQ